MKAWSTIAAELAQGRPCALVSVVATKGSAPRDEGAHMLVTAEGYRGTIGGGTLEWRAIAQAQAQLARHETTRMATFALGPDLGQCCGGRVDLVTECFVPDQLAEVRELAQREAAGPFRVTRHGRSLSFGENLRPVYLFGAGHVGRALVLALAPLPVSVHWVDPRAEAFPSAVPGNVVKRAPRDPVTALAAAPAGSFALIMSHSHALDLAITDAALRNPNFAHVGLIGSMTKRARFESRLAAAGVLQSRIADLICPIGIAAIAGKEPAVIAASVAAQILVLDEALRLATAANPPHHALQKAGGKP
jgi:xanthine dehydrogenase accessory factor